MLRFFGYTLYSKKMIKHYTVEDLKKMHAVDEYDIAYIKGKLNGGLKEKLVSENKGKWLDIGCGGNLEKDFYYLDTFPEGVVSIKDRYFRADIINMSENDFSRVGKFDLVRLQHVFEHFTPENGLKVLSNCARLLNTDGYLLITTPDLVKHIHLFLSGKISENYDWALSRIEKNSPNSFYFSVFAHSLLHEKHKWCYDADGLIYQFQRVGKFKNIQQLKLGDELSNIPFTHNRPEQDVCIIAQVV